ncbi:membrane protein insertase YidC [Treponema pectinovorum]|uniref:membrane protein insertase YidC n=1 Tax=Treponema pectinovorum TaxID=164 RepID=UPI0011C7DBF5|nr:membrane protein insertase YidC [Treponema pectinovorum]
MSFSSILYTLVLYPLVQVIEIAFRIFDKLFDNTGIAVIGVSFTVTILCLPLYIVAEHWQQIERDVQKKLKPGIARIKKTFSGDEQYMILSTFYRQNHYHPLMALRSSFGLLIQIPFFMAAYSCLSKMPALQGESFLFITDMGNQDAIFHIGNFPVNILPIAMTVINIIAGAIYTKGFPIKEKIQIYGMALVFLVILYSSPAGLVLYWTMNNVFSLVKNIFYKLKNPLKVLYYCAIAGILFIAVYVLFIYDGGASMQKRLKAVIPMLMLLPIPLYLKLIKWFLDFPLSSLVENKKLRLNLFLFSSLALTVLAGLVLPSSLISSSTQEFSNVGTLTSPTIYFNWSFWQAAGLFLFWPCCIYFLFGKKLQSIIACFFAIALSCAVINAFAFNGNYGSMDITLKFIGGMNNPSKLFMLANTLVILLTAVIIIGLFKFKKAKIVNSLILIALFSFVALSTINITKIKKAYAEYSKIVASKNGKAEMKSDLSAKFHFSKTGKNIVLVMLDRAESSYFEDILHDRPELYDIYSGFTFYRNALSCNGHTLMGSPALYGGYEYTPDEINKRSDVPLKQKHNEALQVLPTILTKQANFNATLTDLSWANYSYDADMRIFEGKENIQGYKLCGRYTGDFKKQFLGSAKTGFLSDGLKRNLFWVSLFRTSAAIVRPVVYYKGSWWANEITSDVDLFVDWYAILHYLPQITDFSNEKDNLIVMTNETTHTGQDISYMNLTDEKSLSVKTKEDDCYAIDVVSLEALGRWFSMLKENGVYDNTKIVIVADHGIGYGARSKKDYDVPDVNGYPKDHLNPLFLVKDFNATGKLKTDMTFMTNADTIEFLLKDVVENPVNPFTNKKITSESKKDGVIVTIDDMFMPHHTRSKYVFTVDKDSWYKVKDDIFKDENWQPYQK